MPVNQPTPRGFRYAFMKYTENMWTKTEKIIRFAAHECAERISHPKCIS